MISIEKIPLKILLPIIVVIAVASISFTAIILFDPYYSQCKYYTTDLYGKHHCVGTNADKFQNWLSDQIHKLIPYAMAQNTTLSNETLFNLTHPLYNNTNLNSTEQHAIKSVCDAIKGLGLHDVRCD